MQCMDVCVRARVHWIRGSVAGLEGGRAIRRGGKK